MLLVWMKGAAMALFTRGNDMLSGTTMEDMLLEMKIFPCCHVCDGPADAYQFLESNWKYFFQAAQKPLGNNHVKQNAGLLVLSFLLMHLFTHSKIAGMHPSFQIGWWCGQEGICFNSLSLSHQHNPIQSHTHTHAHKTFLGSVQGRTRDQQWDLNGWVKALDRLFKSNQRKTFIGIRIEQGKNRPSNSILVMKRQSSKLS